MLSPAQRSVMTDKCPSFRHRRRSRMQVKPSARSLFSRQLVIISQDYKSPHLSALQVLPQGNKLLLPAGSLGHVNFATVMTSDAFSWR